MDALQMLATIPVIAPVIVPLGFAPVWLGTIIVILIEAALITPPIGLNLYVVPSLRSQGRLNDVIKGALPFVIAARTHRAACVPPWRRLVVSLCFRSMTLLLFHRISRLGVDRIGLEPRNLVIAGWAGRDEEAIRHHIEELAAIGVPRPSSVPVYYRVSAENLTHSERLMVLGADSSGEVEPVLVALADGYWIGLGSDHTDRKAETTGVALSKQLCGKPVGTTLWRLDELEPHWDQLILRSWASIDGERVLYQEGPLSALRTPRDLIERRPDGLEIVPGTLMYCGTLSAIGGIRPGTRFEMELEDPVLNRRMQHAYEIEVLPVIS